MGGETKGTAPSSIQMPKSKQGKSRGRQGIIPRGAEGSYGTVLWDLIVPAQNKPMTPAICKQTPIALLRRLFPPLSPPPSPKPISPTLLSSSILARLRRRGRGHPAAPQLAANLSGGHQQHRHEPSKSPKGWAAAGTDPRLPRIWLNQDLQGSHAVVGCSPCCWEQARACTRPGRRQWICSEPWEVEQLAWLDPAPSEARGSGWLILKGFGSARRSSSRDCSENGFLPFN